MGAGVGLVGIVCAKVGACGVLLTDCADQVIQQNLKRVIQENGLVGTVRSDILAWNNVDQVEAFGNESFDWIIGSDCFYKSSGNGK